MKAIGNILGVSGFAALVVLWIYAPTWTPKIGDDRANAVDAHLASDRGIGASIPVTVTSPSHADPSQGDQQPPPKSLVFHVQVLLKQRGYDPGPVDGIAGAKTKQSIQAFQSSAHLTPDGLVTRELLKQLESIRKDEVDVSGKP